MKSLDEFQKSILINLDKSPQIASDVYIAPHTFLSGDIQLDSKVSIWPGSSLRGDINAIKIGEGSNIQDGCVVHVDDENPTIIGKYVTVGHRAVVHACTIGDECLIGMGAIILDGAIIGARSIIGAGALVTKGTIIPEGSIVLGSPAKNIRPLDEETQASLKMWADRYVRLSREYLRRIKQ